VKAIRVPSDESEAPDEAPSAFSPAGVVLTRVVMPVVRSRRKTSVKPFTSPTTSVDAADSHATRRPSAEIIGRKASAFDSSPVDDTLTRSVIPVRRSWTKTTSCLPFVSPGTRSAPKEAKATHRPSAERLGAEAPTGETPPGEGRRRHLCAVRRDADARRGVGASIADEDVRDDVAGRRARDSTRPRRRRSDDRLPKATASGCSEFGLEARACPSPARSTHACAPRAAASTNPEKI
jgi:hypothetical protein